MEVIRNLIRNRMTVRAFPVLNDSSELDRMYQENAKGILLQSVAGGDRELEPLRSGPSQDRGADRRIDRDPAPGGDVQGRDDLRCFLLPLLVRDFANLSLK